VVNKDVQKNIPNHDPQVFCNLYVIQVEFYLNSYTRNLDVATAIAKLIYGGHEADLAAALRLARTEVFTTHRGARLGDPRVARLAVVFTDSRSVNLTDTVSEAAATRKAGIGIIVVGIGTAVDPYELAAVASYPFHHTVFQVDRLRNLDPVKEPIKRIICRGIYWIYFSSVFLYKPLN